MERHTESVLIKNQKGYSLIEAMFAVLILASTLTGVVGLYFNLIALEQGARFSTLASQAALSRIEDAKRTPFASLASLAGSFTVNGFAANDAAGVTEVINTGYADMRQVRVIVSYRSKNRIIGEDRNLNGVLNSGEDANGNGRLDSPVEVVTFISQ